jgi:hypothetical protein
MLLYIISIFSKKMVFRVIFLDVFDKKMILE